MQNDAARYFTLDEANGLLPEIRELMTILQQKKKQLDDRRWQLAELAQSAKGNGVAAEEKAADLQSAVEILVEEITTMVNEVQGFGCEVKDLDIGLLDFRSFRDGRPVYLCWKLGEDTITYWHDLDTGFAGRQPL